MNPHTSGTALTTRALRRRLYVVGFSPLLAVTAAAFLVSLPFFSALAALVGALVPMIAAESFIIVLVSPHNRPRLQATFGMMWEHVPPDRLQRWYMPLAGGALGAAVAEVIRTVFFFWTAGAPFAVGSLVAPLALGALEGGFLVLVALGAWGFASSLLLGRWTPNRAA